MAIPIRNEGHIANRRYTIVFGDAILRAADCSAQCDNLKEIIRISERRSDNQKFEGLIHEALEGITHTLGLELDHDSLTAIAPCLAQFLISIGVEPNFSTINTEVNV